MFCFKVDGSKNILPAEVNISTFLKTVVEISESSHIIELKFEMNIEWYEHRVEYFNIKENSALNSLTEDEIRLLWLPYIIFEVTIHLTIMSCIHSPWMISNLPLHYRILILMKL